ncbi:CDP-diacylglycerol--serine O-phosphatidyltransferase [Paludibacterium yongneupense]|uniref:CDP-diacylglycerol--serine O-phosphatidyltransferase n=1 Tax=Paludibacterium yongneupense TaxID=400061 RepID=UPI00041A4676|nr:CDP-diacylglycerol--serine O-phosphatidyltransferase [Paludibacterium yongneupense]
MAFLSLRPTPEQLPRFPLQSGSVRTLLCAADLRRTLLDLIASARQRIYLTALYLQNDEAGEEILRALHAARALRPELDICVLVDWHRAQRGLIGEGKQSGNAAWYRSITQEMSTEVPIYGVPVQTRELFGVLHLKGFVIDDTVLYSGASLNNVYLHKLQKYRHDRYQCIDCPTLADSMVNLLQQHLLASPAVHRLDLADTPPTRTLRREIRELRKHLMSVRYDTSQATALPATLAVTPLIGVGRNNALNRIIVDLIRQTEHHLIICTPYFNFPKPVTREVNRLINRGVTVEIIVGDKTANDFFIPPSEPFKVIGALPYLYEINLRRFARRHRKTLEQGQLKIHLWRDGDNSYHLKGLWIDERLHLITGNNLNPRAFSLDLENALLIHDPRQELAGQKREELDTILARTRPIEHYRQLERLGQYPEAVRKLLTRLSRVRIDRLLYRIL